MIDAHCHLDAYPDPYATTLAAERAGCFTIAVTNLPSAFEAAEPHLRGLSRIRLAVGLHPLHADRHAAELSRFERCLGRTSYVGEVGLDFSAEGAPTRERQVESFRVVLRLLRAQPRFVSIHSRRAESAVLDLLEEEGIGPVVFHWFSGSAAQLERLLRLGHLCSVNPAMLRSARGRAAIDRLPPERVLTETDGPYVALGGRPAVPTDVAIVEVELARRWGRSLAEVRAQLRRNLREIVPVAGAGGEHRPNDRPAASGGKCG